VRIQRQSTGNTSARARSILNSFFTWSMQMGFIEQNPVIGTIKPTRNAPRDRVLSDSELAAVWNASGDDDFGRIVRLLCLTGARRKEIGGLRWSELNHDAGTWTLPPERSKNKRAHTLPLPEAAWRIINDTPHLAHRDELFGVRTDGGYTDWAAKARLDQKLGGGVAPWSLHDIRRSVATKMADIGVQPHVIEQILNHRSGHRAGVAGIYNRSSYEREVKAALALWADHVRALVVGGKRKIISFTPAS
jgi:integrase